MSSLVTYLGFIMGDLVDPDDECWDFYLILLEILHIVTKPCTNDTELNYLVYLIKNHNESYIRLFEFHNLVHYPNCIRTTGPLCYLSSIRYEAFHKIGKSSAHVIPTRRNTPYSLAKNFP